LILECDELWSFVGRKREQQWLTLALDRETREVVGVAIGKRDRAIARVLWASLRAVYRQCAVCYSDFWEAYVGVLPPKRHRAVGKESGQTAHVERRATRFVNALGGWFAERWPSLKSWTITLARSGISSITTMPLPSGGE
jgi:IS1 family transposase